MTLPPNTDPNEKSQTGAWFAVSLGEFPKCNEAEVIGKLSTSLANAGFALQLADQTLAWGAQLPVLKNMAQALTTENPEFAGWMVALEYEIPRRGKRIDAVLLTSNVVVVMEFKNGSASYTRDDLWQVENYALDIRDFQERSAGLLVEPVLVATNAPTVTRRGSVSCSNAAMLPAIVREIALSCPPQVRSRIDPICWLKSGYRPTPTIVEAARRVFAGHNVRELSHSYADNLTRTTDAIANLIEYAKCHGRRVVCFVTGVPGSGKTLAGLTAMQDAKAIALGAGTAAFMSGNAPLIRVLREVLVRDQMQKGRRRSETEREIELLIQNVHTFVEEYGVRRTSAVPPDHVIAFDEAQRAWHAAKLSKRHKGIGRSEPDLILDIMSRPESWSVVVALVGGGQEIHDGEAGLEEWGQAIDRSATRWEVVVSPDVLHGGTSVAGHRLFAEPRACSELVRSESAMHLSVSVRSPRAQKIAEWVNGVISLNAAAAVAALESVQGFRLIMTRSLPDMRAWLRESATGTLRAGLLASSGALRLRADGLEIDADFHRNFPIERWFLDDQDDYRSSKSLEVAMTEFECQGLELDYVGLCWGDDLTIGADGTSWVCRRLFGKKWQIRDGKRREYLLNKYRVLMTRAREGLVIWIPRGDHLDPTRLPAPLDRTAAFLQSAGVASLEPS